MSGAEREAEGSERLLKGSGLVLELLLGVGVLSHSRRDFFHFPVLGIAVKGQSSTRKCLFFSLALPWARSGKFSRLIQKGSRGSLLDRFIFLFVGVLSLSELVVHVHPRR